MVGLGQDIHSSLSHTLTAWPQKNLGQKISNKKGGQIQSQLHQVELVVNAREDLRNGLSVHTESTLREKLVKSTINGG